MSGLSDGAWMGIVTVAVVILVLAVGAWLERRQEREAQRLTELINQALAADGLPPVLVPKIVEESEPSRLEIDSIYAEPIQRETRKPW